MVSLEFSQVSKHFGRRVALDEVNLSLAPGSSLGLLGPNGAGKTTTLRLLLGFARPTSGRVRVRGLDPRSPNSRVSLGYLPERLRLPPRATVEGFLSLHGQLTGLSGAGLAHGLDEVCELTGIGDRRDERLGELSKGLAQRVGFAQALLGRPELLLFDEPNSGLDPIGIREARDWILAARDRGCSVLLCSHVLSEIERVCDRVVILDQGRVAAEGPLSEIAQPGESLEDAFVRIVRPS